MKNTTIKFTKLLTALCLLVCLSGCQKKESPLYRLTDIIGSHVDKMQLRAIDGQLETLLCTDSPEKKTAAGERAICIRGLLEATEGPMEELEKLIEETIKTELRKNPKALEAEDQFGLTPAHRILFRIFVKSRGEHFGFTPWIGEYILLDRAFAFTLDKLRTDKKVIGKKIESEPMLSEYLESLGITKKPMSVGEFREQIAPPVITDQSSEWEKVRALKLV